jgi:Cu+-exporting ATPase
MEFATRHGGGGQIREGIMSAGLEHVEIPITGMYCNRCPQAIEKILRGTPGVKKASVNLPTQKAYVWFDPQVASLGKLIEAIRRAGYQSGSSTLRVGIKGMTCASCVTRIEGALKDTSGVLDASVNLGSREARVDYLPSATNLQAIEGAIKAIGYEPIKAPTHTASPICTAMIENGRWKHKSHLALHH